MKQITINIGSLELFVNVIHDYHVKGSFSPDAPSDLDYYGYRETEFEVVKIIASADDGATAILSEESAEQYVDKFVDVIELCIQDTLDDLAADEAA